MKDLLEKIRAAIRAMNPNDPASVILGGMATMLDSMHESIETAGGKIDSIHEMGMTLRIARARNFVVVLFAGIVIGAAGAAYWMKGHGYTGEFWQHGIHVHTEENSDHLALAIQGSNIDEYAYLKDPNGKVVGFRVTYWKTTQPPEIHP